jgi:hypothetical protein
LICGRRLDRFSLNDDDVEGRVVTGTSVSRSILARRPNVDVLDSSDVNCSCSSCEATSVSAFRQPG